MVDCVSAVCAGGWRDGLQQDDGLLLDEAQESGSNNLSCRRMSGSGRMFDQPIALAEQSVVAANDARYGGRAVSDRPCLDGNPRIVEAAKRSN